MKNIKFPGNMIVTFSINHDSAVLLARVTRKVREKANPYGTVSRSSVIRLALEALDKKLNRGR